MKLQSSKKTPESWDILSCGNWVGNRTIIISPHRLNTEFQQPKIYIYVAYGIRITSKTIFETNIILTFYLEPEKSISLFFNDYNLVLLNCYYPKDRVLDSGYLQRKEIELSKKLIVWITAHLLVRKVGHIFEKFERP